MVGIGDSRIWSAKIKETKEGRSGPLDQAHI